MGPEHATQHYYAPDNAAALFALLGEVDTSRAFLAGGITIHWRGSRFARLIDLRHIISRDINNGGNGIVIGAGTTLAAVAAATGLPPALQPLAQACARVASPQIRNVATVGGNLISHFDFSDTLGPLYLLTPDCRLLTRDGIVVRPFAELSTSGRFVLPQQTVLDALVFPAATLAQYRTGVYHKESILRRDLATIGLTVLARTDGLYDCALMAYWPQLRIFRDLDGPSALVQAAAALPPPKSDQRAESAYRQRLLPVITERAFAAVQP